jgi:hypothetical protein
MAINFQTNLIDGALIFSLNNSVIEFSSDNSELPLNAEIQIGTNPSRLIYPLPNNSFYFNFIEYINSVIQYDGNSDNLNYDLGIEFQYDWTSKLYNNDEISVTITFLDDTTESTTLTPEWIRATTDKRRWKKDQLPSNELKVLTPVNDFTDNEATIYRWSGYPFDYTIFNPLTDAVVNRFPETTPIPLINNKIVRLFISDGQIDTDADWLTTIFKNDLNEIVFTLNTVKETDVCDGGYYFKWINKYGGWNYWLFKFGSENLRTNDNGEVVNVPIDFGYTNSIVSQIGKESSEIITVNTDTLDANQKLLISHLFESPKIYLFTGVKGVQATYTEWMEVNLTNSQYLIKQVKTDLNEFTLNFELPPNQNRKL